ncbi:MAG: type VI secretion system-associated protein TagF [Holophagales bacterium]|nr:type VI secretion system-associated protein TagF [Holophagales bacterium]MBK9967472.1 type VI secretion system-associated protein TagF [Holophagales bacterium]
MAAWNLFSKLKDGLSGADGPPKLENYALNLYGKLPIYKDFISSGFTEEGAKEFRDWLGNGFSRRWSVLEEYKGDDIPVHTFLLALPGGKRTVAGALWGSHDEGGLRQFPFTIFSVLPQGRPASDPFVGLSFLEVFAEKADFIRRNFLHGRTVASFYESFRGARIEVPVKRPARIAEGVEKEAKGVVLGDFAESLFGANAVDEWPRFLSRLKTACGHAQGQGAGALRIPLGNLLPAELQVQIWLTWLEGEGSMGVRGPFGTLVCRSGGRSRAVLLFRDLRPEDFLLLHPSRSDYEFVEETAPLAVTPSSGETPPAEPESKDGAGREPAAPSHAAPPAGWDSSLAAFLRSPAPDA